MIEAVQFTGTDSLYKLYELVGHTIDIINFSPLMIKIGKTTAVKGDWLVKGLNGEIMAVKTL